MEFDELDEFDWYYLLISYNKAGLRSAISKGFEGNEKILNTFKGTLNDSHYFTFEKGDEEWQLIFNLNEEEVNEFQTLSEFLDSEYPRVNFNIVKKTDQGFYFSEDHAYMEKDWLEDKFGLELKDEKIDGINDPVKYSHYYDQVPIKD